MNNDGVRALARQLAASLRRLKTHLAWLDLKRSEQRAGEPPAEVVEPRLSADIRNEAGRFMSIAAGLHDALNERAAKSSAEPSSGGAMLRSELLRLESEFRRLSLPKPL